MTYLSKAYIHTILGKGWDDICREQSISTIEEADCNLIDDCH